MASMTHDVLILGGGAAGLMCAIVAAQRGRRVRVIEHANRCGKKILMSGGGRCNFTNLHTTPANYLSANPHFCKSALARYMPRDFIGMVERHGIAYHEKELGQLFCDESSKQIVKMLLDECEWAGAEVRTSCSIESVQREDGHFVLHTTHGVLRAPRCVLATGGLSIPSMGATGFAYELARRFGLKVLPTRAGLVPLTLSGKPQAQWCDLSGLSVRVEIRHAGARFCNAMLITHRGLSGPAILQISSYWQPGEPLFANLLPEHDALAWLREQQQARPNVELKTVLGDVFPQRFAQRVCEVHFDGTSEHALVNQPMKRYVPRQLEAIASVLRAWPIIASGTEGYRTAEVTLGGVDTDELSSSTMECKRVPGLHIIGEALDVTGHLGGFNFQWAWASGHAAGCAV